MAGKYIGLPRKKRYFDINVVSGVTGNAILNDTVLYVLYTYFDHKTEISSTCIRKFNLDSHSGIEEDGEELYFDKENGVPDFCDCGEYIILQDTKNTILKKDNFEVVLSESGEMFASDYGSSPECFVVGNKFFRQLDRENPELGFDVIDLQSKSIIGHLDANLEWPKIICDQFFVGVNTANKIELFSIDDNKAVCELDGREYFDQDRDILPGCVNYALCGNRLAIAYRGIVLVICLKSFVVLQKIDCFSLGVLLKAYENRMPHLNSSQIDGLYFEGNTLIIRGGTRLSFLMRLNLQDPENDTWAVATAHIDAINYAGGDVIFGIDGRRPVAWDLYTGEKVWSASSGTIANRILIGDGWVVYDGPAGYIQCFKWKKPYISPYRPVESK
jgi:hypothetical protein